METNIKLGKEPGLEIDISPAFYVKFFATKTDKSVLSCANDLLKDIDNINLSLSGGLDSQFSLAIAKHLKKDITAYTYRTVWNQTICNAEDVYMAQYMSDKNDVHLNIIDIDLNKFFTDNIHFAYGKQFANQSPQLAVHLYWIDLLHSEYKIKNILMGGDPPLFKYSSNQTSKNKIRMNDTFYHDILTPYYLFCKTKNILCLRDIYYHNPELVYAGFKNNIDVVINKKIYIENDTRSVKTPDGQNYISNSPFLSDNYIFKYEWYNNIIEGLVPQKSETTGFETLKKILASESGVYNRFDQLYRFPMQDQAVNTVRTYMKNSKGRARSRGRNVILPEELNNLFTDFQKQVEITNASPINRYNFDF